MNYTESLAYLDSLGKFGIKLGMERIEGLLRELGNPEQKLKTVHVTGTNGKGSVTSMITNILLAANLKVGKFTSPHLVKYNERINLNGKDISDEDFAMAITAVKVAADSVVKKGVCEQPTKFEILTAAAFLYFICKKLIMRLSRSAWAACGILRKIFGVTAEGIWVDPKQFPDIKVRVFSTLVNPNILAGYLVLVIAYSTAFFNQTKAHKKWRLAFLVTGLLAALCLLYTYSRGNWVACAVMLLAFCVLFCRKAFIPILGGGAAVLATGGTAVLHRLASIQGGYGGDTSIALRMAYLKSTKWIIEEFPLGVGWYGYRFVYPTYNFYLADKSVIMYYCHNIFLNIWAELGLHGLLAFLVVWFGIFLPAAWRLAYHGRSLWLKAMGRGYVLATVGIIVGGLTDHVYFNTQMGLLFWTLGTLTMICAKMSNVER